MACNISTTADVRNGTFCKRFIYTTSSSTTADISISSWRKQDAEKHGVLLVTPIWYCVPDGILNDTDPSYIQIRESTDIHLDLDILIHDSMLHLVNIGLVLIGFDRNSCSWIIRSRWIVASRLHCGRIFVDVTKMTTSRSGVGRPNNVIMKWYNFNIHRSIKAWFAINMRMLLRWLL